MNDDTRGAATGTTTRGGGRRIRRRWNIAEYVTIVLRMQNYPMTPLDFSLFLFSVVIVVIVVVWYTRSWPVWSLVLVW